MHEEAPKSCKGVQKKMKVLLLLLLLLLFHWVSILFKVTPTSSTKSLHSKGMDLGLTSILSVWNNCRQLGNPLITC